jgi:hypothetical protein
LSWAAQCLRAGLPALPAKRWLGKLKRKLL